MDEYEANKKLNRSLRDGGSSPQDAKTAQKMTNMVRDQRDLTFKFA